jgi:hypothetical protein
MSDTLPESVPEKRKSFETGRYLEHWMYVHELRAILDKLRPDDWLTPNEVHNLCVNREGDGFIGYIDFLDTELELFSEQDNDED